MVNYSNFFLTSYNSCDQLADENYHVGWECWLGVLADQMVMMKLRLTRAALATQEAPECCVLTYFLPNNVVPFIIIEDK